MAFVADCRMVANLWLRSGNTGFATNMQSFLEDTLDKLRGKKIGLLRADSGFYGEETFRYLEEREDPIHYIIAARLYNPVQRTISQQRIWWEVENGIAVSETQYDGRRMVIIRQHVPDRPKATGKQLRLFQDNEIYTTVWSPI